MKASFRPYVLEFKQASGTSRGVLKTKQTYFIELHNGTYSSIGECALFRGLSCDDVPEYEEVLADVCLNIEAYLDNYHEKLLDFPSIIFGLEQALLMLENKGQYYFDNAFTRGEVGIPINGLIWMGSESFMLEQIEAKLAEGFTCLKMKIGAIDFFKEYDILRNLRKAYPKELLEIRVDANGAFSVQEVYNRLDELSKLDLHSIEQPIKAGQAEAMEKLCRFSALPIALDEELIGVKHLKEKETLLNKILPQYIILKPALVGGFRSCDEWIALAEKLGIAWWITSALESNVGLDAIAQYTASKNTTMFQGLGTGKLFTNNIDSSLRIENAKLWK